MRRIWYIQIKVVRLAFLYEKHRSFGFWNENLMAMTKPFGVHTCQFAAAKYFLKDILI